MNLSLIILSLEVNVTKRVNNQDLAVLSNNTLASTSGANSGSRSGISRLSRALGAADLLDGLSTVALLGLLVHATLSSVLGQRGSFFLLALGRSGSRGRSRSSFDTGDVKTATPSSFTGKLDVALDKLGLTLPAHVEGKVVNTATNDEEQTNHNRAQAGSVAVVVVIGALPEREAIGEEMVVTVAFGATEDVGNEGQTSLSLASLLDSGFDLSIGGRLDLLALLLVLSSLGSH